MPIKRRSSKLREQVTAAQLAYLSDEPWPPETTDFERWLLECGTDEEIGELWAQCRDEILAAWADECPGTRPSTWWRCSAPGPRVRIGGIGVPSHEQLANVLRLHLGLPLDWIGESDLAAFGAIGKPLGVPAVDPANPPRYESEATYLDRLGFLLPGERKRLTAADFQPEKITDIFDLRGTE